MATVAKIMVWCSNNSLCQNDIAPINRTLELQRHPFIGVNPYQFSNSSQTASKGGLFQVVIILCCKKVPDRVETRFRSIGPVCIKERDAT